MKVLLTFVLLFALVVCEDTEITLKSNNCTADEANGSLLLKGNNKVIVTLEAKTNCGPLADDTNVYIYVEKRMSSIGIKVNEYYTGGEWKSDLKWKQQVLVEFTGYGTNQNGDYGGLYLAPK